MFCNYNAVFLCIQSKGGLGIIHNIHVRIVMICCLPPHSDMCDANDGVNLRIENDVI